MDIKNKFLSGILGKDGAQALKKAVQSDARLQPVILPRAIIGWLSFISQYEYEGELPGVDNSYIEFTKNQDETFSGSIAIGEEVHEFENTDIYHVASAISVSIGEDADVADNEVRDLVLVRLGKSIDALAKAHEISRTLASRLVEPKEESSKEESSTKKDELDKTDLPGKTAAPTKQQGPIGPMAPRKQGRLPRPPSFKAPSLKIGKTESCKVCGVCDGSQFSGNKFTGCICFRDLAKSINTTAYSDGYALDFKTDFDKEAYMVLSKYFRS